LKVLLSILSSKAINLIYKRLRLADRFDQNKGGQAILFLTVLAQMA
jgi:hypothetical protein